MNQQLTATELLRMIVAESMTTAKYKTDVAREAIMRRILDGDNFERVAKVMLLRVINSEIDLHIAMKRAEAADDEAAAHPANLPNLSEQRKRKAAEQMAQAAKRDQLVNAHRTKEFWDTYTLEGGVALKSATRDLLIKSSERRLKAGDCMMRRGQMERMLADRIPETSDAPLSTHVSMADVQTIIDEIGGVD